MTMVLGIGGGVPQVNPTLQVFRSTTYKVSSAMNRTDFTKFVERVHAECCAILGVKGADYSGSEDVLANFKRLADRLGLTPLQVAAVYATKHWDAILSYVANPSREPSEPIHGRFLDMMNYCTLMAALVDEANAEQGLLSRLAPDFAPTQRAEL